MNLSTTIAFGSCKPHEQTTTRKLLMILPDHDISSSLTTRTPLSYSSSSNQYSHRHQLKSSSSPRPLAVKEKKQLRRREFTIGFGLLLGVVDAFQLVLGHPQQAAAAAQAQAQKEEEFTVTSSGLQFFDQVIGTGPQPSKGQLIKAHYIGKLENGVIFDSSYSRGKPLTFRVGVGEVIKGWDQGILGGDGIPPMLPGGKRSLKLPPELGYGVRGAGCKGGSCIIPPNSTLLFQVELIGKA